MSKIKELFKNHPSQNEVFETADGFCFFEKSKAEGHAQSLKDREVQMHTREEAESDAEAKAKADAEAKAKADAAAKAVEAPVAEAEAPAVEAPVAEAEAKADAEAEAPAVEASVAEAEASAVDTSVKSNSKTTSKPKK